MKTADEIKEWLRKQDWFGAFVKNVEEYYYNDGMLSDIINGKRGRTTILEAFTWRDTEEGRDFWCNIEKQYLEWYDEK